MVCVEPLPEPRKDVHHDGCLGMSCTPATMVSISTQAYGDDVMITIGWYDRCYNMRTAVQLSLHLDVETRNYLVSGCGAKIFEWFFLAALSW